MLNLSEYFGEGVGAWFSGAETDFTLPQQGEIFGAGQQRTLRLLNIDPEQVANIRQVHGGKVIAAQERFYPVAGEDLPEADAAVTNVRGVALMVRTADCVPVFLYDPQKQCIGLVHAGWRSSRERIVCSAVEMMCSAYGSGLNDLRAAIGPCIHACCYEVNQDRCLDFPEHVIPRSGQWFLDLPSVNQDQLISSGVDPEKIYQVPFCTCCDEAFFSYRRQGERAGRHAAVLKLNQGSKTDPVS